MLRLNVHLFARARELAGTPTVPLTVVSGTTVAQLRQRLAELVPALAAMLPRCAIAVNQDFVAEDHALTADAEIAVIPPVSGGCHVQSTF